MTKIKKTLLALCFVVLAASALSITSPLLTPAAHAALTPAEQQDCYDRYNGKKASEIGVVLENQCFVQNACNFSSNDLNAVARCTLASGSDPTENIARAKAAPTVTLICGTAPPSNSPSPGAITTYNNCANAVRATFETDCVNTAEEEARTDAESISGIAACITPALNKIPGGKRVTEAQVRTTVASGLDAAEKAANEAGTEKRKTECEASGGTWENNTCIPAAEDIEAVCDGGALGWIICPLMEIASGVTEQVAKQIENLMTFQPLLSREKNSQGAVLYTIWSTVVGLANILLVIAFLVVIFSQATSIGLSNYGIKKMLPRIIAAAILMNLSFFICAIAVDISNILGQGVKGIIVSAISALPSIPEIKEAGGNPDLQVAWGPRIGFYATALVALGVGAATGTLGLILVALASIATFVFTAFVMLALRNVLLALVIIVAPLAFVAMILPGTNGLFTKWRKLFTGLLVLFPLIMLLLYGGMLISHIILFTYDPKAGDLERIFVVLTAAVAAVLGVAGIPTAFNAFMGLVGKVTAGRLNNPSKGLVDRTRNWQKARGKRIRGNNAARMASAEWGKNWGLNEDGSKKTGGRARIARGLGVGAGTLAAGARFTGGYGARKARKHAWQEENAKRIQEEEIFERLAETNPKTGAPTGRAQRYAAAAAGAGGEKNAERIRRLALEQKKKAFVDDVVREQSAMVTAGAMDSGATYFEFNRDGTARLDRNGKQIQHNDHGRAMTAIARGDTTVGVVKAGQAQTPENARKNLITGDNEFKRNAAMKRMAEIGDGAAIGYALYGDQKQGIQALQDNQFSDYVQWIGDNAGKVSPKLSHLITNDNGLNGVSGDALADWHGNEFLAAGSRVRQLREQATRATTTAERDRLNNGADKIQNAVETAYKTLSSDPNLEGKFKQKHVDAMRNFIDIVNGDQARVVMREYGDRQTDARIVGGRIADTAGSARTGTAYAAKRSTIDVLANNGSKYV